MRKFLIESIQLEKEREVVACVRGVQSYTLNKENKEDVFTLALVEAFERVEGDVRVGGSLCSSQPPLQCPMIISNLTGAL